MPRPVVLQPRDHSLASMTHRRLYTCPTKYTLTWQASKRRRDDARVERRRLRAQKKNERKKKKLCLCVLLFVRGTGRGWVAFVSCWCIEKPHRKVGSPAAVVDPHFQARLPARFKGWVRVVSTLHCSAPPGCRSTTCTGSIVRQDGFFLPKNNSCTRVSVQLLRLP